MSDENARRASIFGSFADEYERWRPTYPAQAVDWLIPPGASRVADVGAGTGKLTGALLARGLHVTAVEPDPGMLAVLIRLYPQADARRSDASALPLPDSSVDVVTVAQAWHWFDHDRAVVEIERVLRPGGWLSIIGNEPDPRESWQHELHRHQPDYREPDEETEASVPGAPAGATVDWATFAWTRELTPTQLRANLATHSAYAVMAPEQRRRRLDEATAVVDAEVRRSGSTTVGYRMVASCARVRFEGR